MANYNDKIDDFGDIMAIDTFREYCKSGIFVDYDGHGHPIRDDKMSSEIFISPSNYLETIPDDATHVIWYNK